MTKSSFKPIMNKIVKPGIKFGKMLDSSKWYIKE
jgi:hypothetical protein